MIMPHVNEVEGCILGDKEIAGGETRITFVAVPH